MTSEARERSWSDGKPIHLFRFTRGNVSWYYTSADRDQEYLDETWTAAAIKRDTSIRQGSDSAQLSIKVSMPSSLPVAANWRPYPASEAIVLTIFVRHAGETDAMAEWVGRVVGPKFDGAKLTLTGEPSSTANRRQGNKRCWQRGCGHALYSQGVGLCNVSRATHALSAVLTVASGLTLTAAEFATLPSGRLAGGYIEWTRASDGLVEFRTIKSHAGGTVSLDYGALDLAVDLEVTAYPGCAHTWADCGYYSNQPNYGGDLWMPVKGPYDGNPVW